MKKRLIPFLMAVLSVIIMTSSGCYMSMGNYSILGTYKLTVTSVISGEGSEAVSANSDPEVVSADSALISEYNSFVEQHPFSVTLEVGGQATITGDLIAIAEGEKVTWVETEERGKDAYRYRIFFPGGKIKMPDGTTKSIESLTFRSRWETFFFNPSEVGQEMADCLKLLE